MSDSTSPAAGLWTRIRDAISFLAGLGLLVHETVVIADPPGPRLLLLTIAVPLLGLAPATMTNRWLQGTTPPANNEQDSNAARS